MMAGVVALSCSICGEPSSDICVYCTKDACANHRCDRCKRCSDCCECDVPLSAAEIPIEPVAEAPAEAFLAPQPALLEAEPETVQPTPEQETPPGDGFMF